MDKILQDALEAMDGDELSIALTGRKLRALFYGDFGAGKTTLAAQLVENKGCLITTDSNWVVILKYPEIAAKITRYAFEGFTQLQAIAKAHAEGIEPWCTYDTLIWDTASRGIERFVGKLVDRKKFNDQRDPDVQSWTHYNLTLRRLSETVDILSKTDLNIIYTTHLREPTEQDRNRKRFAIRPNAPEKSFELLGQEVSLIGWVYKENKGGKRLVSFEGTNLQTGKSQISTIDERTYVIDEIPDLIRKWRNN